MKAIPKTAPKRPWYLPRSAGVNRSPMTASAIGNSEPAPMPWMPRKSDQLGHVLRQAGQRGADQEDDDADDEHRLPAVEVGQLAPERNADRAGQQVDRDGPDVDVVACELGHDRRQGRTDDRLVERAQEQAEHDREEDLHLRALAQTKRWIFGERRVWSPARPEKLPRVLSPFLRWAGDGVWSWPCERSGPNSATTAPRRSSRAVGDARSSCAARRDRPRIDCSRSCLSASVSSRAASPPATTRTRTTRRSSGTRTRSTRPALLHPIDDPGGVAERRRRGTRPSGSSAGRRDAASIHRTCMCVMLTPGFTSRPVPAHRNPPMMSWKSATIRSVSSGSVRGPSAGAASIVRMT